MEPTKILVILSNGATRELLVAGFEQHKERNPRANHELDLIVLKSSIELELRRQEPTKRTILDWIVSNGYAELSENSSHSVWRSLRRLEDSGYIYQTGKMGIYRPTQVIRNLGGGGTDQK